MVAVCVQGLLVGRGLLVWCICVRGSWYAWGGEGGGRIDGVCAYGGGGGGGVYANDRLGK